MSENTQTERVALVNLDNVALKQWLRDKGAVGRREALTKLKAALQNLGLSRRQVHQGLLQLSTKPRVILTRHNAYRRYGSRQSLEEHGESIDADKNRKPDAAFLDHRPLPEDGGLQIPDSTQRIAEEDPGHDETMQRMKKFKADASINTDRSMLSKSCKSNDHRTAVLHSFDKALEQLDCIFSSTMNAEKLNAKRSSVIVSNDSSKSQNKSHVTNLNEKRNDDRLNPICDKLDQIVFDRSKTNRTKSDKKETNRPRPEINKESDIKNRVQADSASNRKKHAKEDNHKSPFSDNSVTRLEESKETTNLSFAQNRRKRIHASADERYGTRMIRNLRYKFRTCFGDCNSISEDEQEQTILKKRFKRRRKTDSVDSCDSGVCFSDGSNAISNNGIEILKDIQKAVPDSTMHEISEDTSSDKMDVEADTIDTSKDDVDRNEKVIETNEIENVPEKEKSSNSVCEANNEIVQRELHGVSDESNLVQSTTTSETEKSNVSVLESKETSAENDVSSCIPNPETDTTKDLPKSQTGSSDLRDLNELFQIDFNENCQITSNGNVLSIQEKDNNQNIVSKDSDKNIPYGILMETAQADCNQNTKPASKVINNNNIKNTGSCSDKKKIIETVPVKISLSNLLGNADNTMLPKSKLNDILEKKIKVTLSNSESSDKTKDNEEVTILDSLLNDATKDKNEATFLDKENENTQSNQVPKIKLRVLSSAELGSRWCPTPINAVISTTSELPSTNTITRSDNGSMYNTNGQVSSSSAIKQPMTQPIITAATPAPASSEAASNNLKKSTKDPRFAKAVYNSLVNIYQLILNTRISHVDNSRSLLKEFEKLRLILNIDDRIHLINEVIAILNKQLLSHQPLSPAELLHYIPVFKRCYSSQLFELIHSNGYQNVTPAVVPNKTTTQNSYNSQGLQSVPTTSVQRVIQNMLSGFIVKNSVNVASEPVQQNCQETLQQQNSSVQNNVPMNPAAINCGVQQMNCRMPMQQKIPSPNAYFIRQQLVNNIPAQQRISMQYFSPLAVNNNQQGIRYSQPAAVSAANTTFMHNYMSNTYCNMNTMNYTSQQSVNQTQVKNTKNANVPCMSQQNTAYRQPFYNTSQGIQPQLPQNIPVILNRSVPTAQSTFVSNTPQIIPMNVQKNEQVQQRVPVQQTRAPQNVPLKPQVQQTQFARKKQSSAQISLESTVKQFHVLKYLSGIQKILLLKQIDSYFGCTSWLQQQFTSEQWQVIHSERSLLLHFQTLLKHIVEKTISDLSNTPQPSVLENNIQISIPKTVQIIVPENVQMHCQVKTLNAEEQCKITNIESGVPRQETNTSTSESQLENEQGPTDDLPKKLPSQIQESETVQNEEIQRDMQIEETIMQENQAAITSILEIQKISENNVNERDTSEMESENSADLCSLNTNDQSLPSSMKTIDNSLYAAEKEVVSPNLKVSDKDALQQPGPHLVTVAISSHSDRVTVIDTNAVNKYEDEEVKLVVKETKECEQLEEEKPNLVTPPPCLQDDVSEDSLKFVTDIKDLSKEELNNITLEETSIIADVRSITLEAFEKMETSNNVLASNSEGTIEEEEIKICLLCGKPSTVACAFCFEAKYCSEECSKLHWEEHYQDCKPVENSVFIV